MGLTAEQVTFEGCTVDLLVKAALQLAADANNDKTAHCFQGANEDKEPHDHQRQHGQGGGVLRRQHPVIHLKHINGGH